MLLAGDIGGTKTLMAIFESQDKLHEPLAQKSFHSASYPSLEAIAKEFLAQTAAAYPVDRACFDVAGPVLDGRVKTTNLPWEMDVRIMQRELDLKAVCLLNDLEAMANAVPILEQQDLITLSTGQAEPGGAIAVIAPGTGLGEAFLTWDGAAPAYQAHASEGGHTNFAPTNPQQTGLLNHLFKKYDHVSYERVCSGIGIPEIYDYFNAIGYAPETAKFAAALATTKDRTPLIMQAAIDEKRPSERARATLELFLEILGAEAGNLALKVFATGGVYFGGGIPMRILPHMQNGIVMQNFVHKGRFAGLLARMPVHVITNPNVALLGAASCGFKMG